jgi:hypothetical protein
MNLESNGEKMDLESAKERIAQIQQKPLDTHSEEFEKVHGDLTRVLSEIDGL